MAGWLPGWRELQPTDRAGAVRIDVASPRISRRVGPALPERAVLKLSVALSKPMKADRPTVASFLDRILARAQQRGEPVQPLVKRLVLRALDEVVVKVGQKG